MAEEQNSVAHFPVQWKPSLVSMGLVGIEPTTRIFKFRPVRHGVGGLSVNPDRRKVAVCLCCGKSYKYGKNRTGKYCSNQCHQDFMREHRIQGWLNGLVSPMKAGGRICVWVRDYLIRESDGKCSECGWSKVNPNTGKTPLEIDHIDGDASNCHPSNLRVLCPNCHSLTPTYKALNRGNGCKERLRYSRLLH